ncbi:hypothetical protein [Halobacillus sp. Marseille-Q1614]|uniref:hypothetical protein n=1 Tax=Halobacillus sp. Marseille-Q1614 TaxID=2709134 RepID=UPI00156EB89E|nr:hypothetical protein [Halobacillus sp. Marseille-Q1614]
MDCLLNRSAETKEKLEIIYITNSWDISQRTIRVLTVQSDKILAYCFLREEVRTFSKDQILSVFPYKPAQKNLLSS